MKTSSLTTRVVTALFVLAVILYFGVQAWHYFTSPEITTPVYSYRAEHTVSVSGFVVRDEEVVECGETLLELTRAEGERVARGKVIATVYQSAEALDAARELSMLRSQLEQLQYAQDAARDTEAALRLDTEIETNIISLRAALTGGNYAAVETGVTELESTVLRREYAYRGSADLSERIESLEAEISAVSGSVGNASRVVTAPFAGTYSAVTDGYESVLTPELLENITPSRLLSLKPEGPVSTVGKLVRGERWYYAAVMSEEDARGITKGGSYELDISGVDIPLPTVAYSIGRAENGRCLVVFRSSRYLSHVTMLRDQSAELILDSHTGLRVPKNALRINEDQQLGVYCRIGREAFFKPVELIYQGEDYCLVQPGEIEAKRDSDLILYTLRSGDEVIVSAGELYNGKVIN